MLLPATRGQLAEVAVLMLQVSANSYQINHWCCRTWCGLLPNLQKPGSGCFGTLTSNFCLCILIISSLLHLFCQIVFSLEALWVKFYVHSSVSLVICPPQFLLITVMNKTHNFLNQNWCNTVCVCLCMCMLACACTFSRRCRSSCIVLYFHNFVNHLCLAMKI